MAGAENKADMRQNEYLCCRYDHENLPSQLIRERSETRQKAEGLKTMPIHDSESLKFKLFSDQQSLKHLPLEATLSGGFRGAKSPHDRITELHDPRCLALIFQV
jgi:hypothetical protein